MTRETLTQRVRGDRGAVLPWFSIWLPVLLIFVVFVVDVANWFEHKRHLQMQADAAALAGAGKFRLPLSLCSDAAVKAEARKYAGDHLDGGEILWLADFNDQIGGTPATRMHSLINFDVKERTDPDYPGRFWRSDADDDGPSPCASKFIEVKMTEQDLPWFFGVPPLSVPWIDARARVTLKQLRVSTGMLPIAVPDTDPAVAAATFINECDGSVIATTQLKKQATPDGTLTVWANNGVPGVETDVDPVSVPMPTTCTHVGVRIALGTNTTSTSCSHPLVDCYELGSANALLYLRSYRTDTLATQATPQLRSVELVPATTGCADGSFFTMLDPPPEDTARPCTGIGVRAKIDFGLLGPLPDTKVEAEWQVGNTPKRRLTYDPVNDVWETSATELFDPNAGPGGPFTGRIPVKLIWCVSPGGSGCGGSAPYLEGGTVVQRSYGGTDLLSGPVKLIQTFDAGGVRTSAAAAGTSPDLIVRIALVSNVKVAQSVNDPLVRLRIRGNQNQALNCDVDYTTLSDELAYGCGRRTAAPASPFAERYIKNDGSVDCRNTNRATLWSWQANNQSEPEWPCVAIVTGVATNQIPKGLNQRILGDEQPTSCTSPNNWALYWTTGLPDGDPRVVQVVLTPFGAFMGSGNDATVPVTGFATFYITGWTGQGEGFNNPCQGNGDDPAPNPGTIVGHYISYIDTVNNGASDIDCDENSPTPCVAVLTD